MLASVMVMVLFPTEATVAVDMVSKLASHR
jgi:hypothetical protein